MKIRIV